MRRHRTKKIRIGSVCIGKDYPIAVQSMCNTKTQNIKSTLKQINELEETGCDIVRLAVPNLATIHALKKIRKETDIPLVADIHFDYKIAIAVMPFVDKIRIDPGNIGARQNLKRVITSAKDQGIPIRIGINSGSLEKSLLRKYGGPKPIALVESALKDIKFCEKNNFENIVVSIKSTSLLDTIRANEAISKKTEYPLHLGITQAGPVWNGTIRSSIGLGCLLERGIGDTIRVSLTGSPIEEVKVGFEILKALELRQQGVTIISCPSCGRTEIDLAKLVSKIQKATKKIKKPIKIAVMGCVVNGPGEAREADIGLAGGHKCGAIFRKGKIIKRVSESKIVPELLKQINKLED
ncbi:MAG: 4-hydroxy-3-methylbut-2-en-1-yl diphosphate synthase [Candidatus Levybacteria bacterium CG10_big_fil_rev_8_21_14_0_10_36_7]|nr:MAG: 4-hydroxy-3-methylbut-2-en-1-yl diphosphate synthase [Candidatus Levybacteria bacterium CG10_big_fil_rev_8_21_14_0_10_36_7]